MTAAPLLLYDGDCALCNGTVAWVLRRDPGGPLRFAALQGETGKALLARLGLTPAPGTDFDTFLFVKDPEGPAERVFERSSAAVRLLAYLGRGWQVLGALLWLVPRPLRNLGYRLVARNRKKLVKAEGAACPLPPPGDRKRFMA